MSAAVKTILLELLGSKKFSALLLGLMVTCVSYPLTRWAGLEEASAVELATTISTAAMGLVSAYMLAQGGADFGKEAKKIAPRKPKVE